MVEGLVSERVDRLVFRRENRTFEFADYGIVGDLFDVVPAIIEKLE